MPTLLLFNEVIAKVVIASNISLNSRTSCRYRRHKDISLLDASVGIDEAENHLLLLDFREARRADELRQNSVRTPSELRRAPSELRQNSVRAPSELRQSSVRAPSELRQNSVRTPSELRQKSNRKLIGACWVMAISICCQKIQFQQMIDSSPNRGFGLFEFLDQLRSALRPMRRQESQNTTAPAVGTHAARPFVVSK